jgi:hypothetical protein
VAIKEAAGAGDDFGSDLRAMFAGIGHAAPLDVSDSMRGGAASRPSKYDLEHILLA